MSGRASSISPPMADAGERCLTLRIPRRPPRILLRPLDRRLECQLLRCHVQNQARSLGPQLACGASTVRTQSWKAVAGTDHVPTFACRISAAVTVSSPLPEWTFHPRPDCVGIPRSGTRPYGSRPSRLCSTNSGEQWIAGRSAVARWPPRVRESIISMRIRRTWHGWMTRYPRWPHGFRWR